VSSETAAPATLSADGRAALRERAERLLRLLVAPTPQRCATTVDGDRGAGADHRRALVVQRTGWGKSAVYFVATGLLRAAALVRA
jgi:ATP-dependent DNA helicase RecQ